MLIPPLRSISDIFEQLLITNVHSTFIYKFRSQLLPTVVDLLSMIPLVQLDPLLKNPLLNGALSKTTLCKNSKLPADQWSSVQETTPMVFIRQHLPASELFSTGPLSTKNLYMGLTQKVKKTARPVFYRSPISLGSAWTPRKL